MACLKPIRRLNSDDLPVFGRPTSAIIGFKIGCDLNRVSILVYNCLEYNRQLYKTLSWQNMDDKLDYRKVCLVTKGRSIAQIDQLLLKFPELKIMGENYYPECWDKFLYYRGIGYECHFLGRLQSNKIKKIVEICDVIQSVDSLSKLLKIEACAADLQKRIKILVQVNLGDDTKAGVPIADLLDFFAQIPWSELRFVEVSGLMTVGFLADLDKTEAGFRNLAELYEILSSKYPDLNTLSMGMSDDYPLALKYGSNLLRLGRYFFEAD